MFNNIIYNKFSCGLDIGARSIKAAVLKKNNDSIELQGVFDNKTYGFKNASISDLAELSECINTVVSGLNKKLDIKIKELHVGINGQLVTSRKIKTAIPLVDRGNKVITKRDISNLGNNARLLGVKVGEEILHSIAQGYKVDDMNFSDNPLGLFGRKLEISSMLLISNVSYIRNISKAVHQAGYEVAKISFSPYSAASAVFSHEQLIEGCVLIDIGAKCTTVMVFKNGAMQHMAKINIGGDSFTNCISRSLALSFDLADEIKKSYAVASSQDLYPEEEILVKRESEYIPIKKDRICAAIEPDICRLESEIKTILETSGYMDKLNSGMTIIGGGSLLPGLIERIGNATGVKSRSGKNNVQSKTKQGNAVMFSGVIGLAMQGFETVSSAREGKNKKKSILSYIADKLRDLYQEYF